MIQQKHLDYVKNGYSTVGGMELLELDYSSKNNYAANVYLESLVYINELRARLEKLEKVAEGLAQTLKDRAILWDDNDKRFLIAYKAYKAEQ